MNWNSKNATVRFDKAGWLATKGSNLLLTGARLLDPANDIDTVGDIFVEKGKIRAIGKIKKADLPKHRTINLRGKIIAPGFLDMHVHLREPGREDKETILSGTCAAAAGGFTAVACMPNTDPPMDNTGVIKWVIEQAESGPVTVHPVAAITRDRAGKQLTDIADMHTEAGVLALSDDGSPLASAEIMRRVLEYSRIHDLVISTHSEDLTLAGKGVMREGEWSTRLGMPGWPSLAEAVMVARDLLLAEFTGGRLHIGHISSKESIDLVRWAKARGVNVTCEATPHHLSLTDEAVASFSGNFKMNPPLGTKEDRDAVLKGLKDGTIDAIATDHAPHTDEESLVEYSMTPNGVVGLETAVGVVAKELVAKKLIDWPDVVRLMSIAPRQILHAPKAEIRKGAKADLTIIDPEATWAVDAGKFLSKGHNTPFDGWTLPAKPLGVISNGWLVLAPEGRMLAG